MSSHNMSIYIIFSWRLIWTNWTLKWFQNIFPFALHFWMSQHIPPPFKRHGARRTMILHYVWIWKYKQSPDILQVLNAIFIKTCKILRTFKFICLTKSLKWFFSLLNWKIRPHYVKGLYQGVARNTSKPQ